MALVIGLLAGAGFGYVKSVNNKTYGSTLVFFVNPEKEGQTNQQIYGVYGTIPVAEMIGQLDSGLFSEYLFLNDLGLPNKEINDDIDAKVDIATPFVEARNALTIAKKAKLDEVKTAVEEYNYAHIGSKVSLNKEGLPEQKVNDDIDTLVLEAKTLMKQEREAIVAAQPKIKDAIDAWKLTSDYKTLVKMVDNATTYTRGANKTELNKEENAANNTSFITVEINANNEAFAKILRDKLVEKLPLYVEDNMLVPDGFDGTNCVLMSRVDDIVFLGEGQLMSTCIKYAVLLGAAATFVACGVVLVLAFVVKKPQETPVDEEKTQA